MLLRLSGNRCVEQGCEITTYLSFSMSEMVVVFCGRVVSIDFCSNFRPQWTLRKQMRLTKSQTTNHISWLDAQLSDQLMNLSHILRKTRIPIMWHFMITQPTTPSPTRRENDFTKHPSKCPAQVSSQSHVPQTEVAAKWCLPRHQRSA
jgi:hypothetical protein